MVESTRSPSGRSPHDGARGARGRGGRGPGRLPMVVVRAAVSVRPSGTWPTRTPVGARDPAAALTPRPAHGQRDLDQHDSTGRQCCPAWTHEWGAEARRSRPTSAAAAPAAGSRGHRGRRGPAGRLRVPSPGRQTDAGTGSGTIRPPSPQVRAATVGGGRYPPRERLVWPCLVVGRSTRGDDASDPVAPRSSPGLGTPFHVERGVAHRRTRRARGGSPGPVASVSCRLSRRWAR
jgi:hypothetical protein